LYRSTIELLNSKKKLFISLEVLSRWAEACQHFLLTITYLRQNIFNQNFYFSVERGITSLNLRFAFIEVSIFPFTLPLNTPPKKVILLPPGNNEYCFRSKKFTQFFLCNNAVPMVQDDSGCEQTPATITDGDNQGRN